MLSIPSDWIGKAIYLEFHDPYSHSNWESRMEIIEWNPMLCASVGFLLHFDDEKIIICLTRSEENDMVSDSFILPRNCVANIKRLIDANFSSSN